MRILPTIVVTGLLTSAVTGAELRIGSAAVVINPAEGTPLAGYYELRGSKTTIDDIYAKALVLHDGTTGVALVTCDLITMPRHIVREARRLIAKDTGIPEANVMISATHTHTGPVISRESPRDDYDGSNNELAKRYAEQLPAKIAEAVTSAHRRLTAGKAAAVLGSEAGISFNRRFIMKDGSVTWNPGKRNPAIVKPAGPIDPDVHTVYFESADAKPIATYVNFAMHPDTVGGQGVSADYPGVVSRLLGEYRGKEMVTLFANGCCGNINHRNIQWTDRQKGPSEALRLGTTLAGSVMRSLPDLQPLSAGKLAVRTETVKLPLAPITEKDVDEAKAVVRRLTDPTTKFIEKVKAFQVLDVAERKGKPWEMEVQVIALGDRLAWVSLPGEIFVEIGLAIKKDSPFRYTLIAELANGSVGYVPDKSAYPQGQYEVISARCGAGSGELLAEAAVRMLKQLHAEAVRK